ncbi:hypothetical protein [Pseudaminobacter soli (ex Li et al. 2025)]|uniref:Uncharacterized protein n=1 Tax=Pseudaminobacter soli (ex Li et al. 2025) TaxID=1295366 RepID=A0A2P7RZL1_9HYPH|nr:hypothetical protein [Mesorhizobium soli]PSJ55644.1 hypothetical protein C7I85_26730 [Mesorhizobium soli]
MGYKVFMRLAITLPREEGFSLQQHVDDVVHSLRNILLGEEIVVEDAGEFLESQREEPAG